MPYSSAVLRPTATILSVLFTGLALTSCGRSSQGSTPTQRLALTPANTVRTRTSSKTHHAIAKRNSRAARPHRSSATPRYTHALHSFADCINAHGVNLPPPNTSGTGAIFSAEGVNTASPAFKTAIAACQSILRAAPQAKG